MPLAVLLEDAMNVERMHGSIGSGRFVCAIIKWAGLALALAINVPWPLNSKAVPVIKPSRCALGTARVSIVGLALNTDGRTVATTDESGAATVWRAVEVMRPQRVFKLDGLARVVDFSPDGRYLAIDGNMPHVLVWNLAREDWERPLRIPMRTTSHLKFSPDGRTLAVSSFESPEIVLWDFAERRERLSLKGHLAPVMHLAFSLDGLLLASAAGTSADSPIRVWNLATGQEERRITGLGSAPQAIAFSPDGSLLASASPHEKIVRLWNARTGEPYMAIAGHALSTRSVAYSPDGRLLATASGDGTGALWSVATGREVWRLDGQADVLHNIAFSPDGRTLVATANDGDIRLWELENVVGDDNGTLML
jgi:dipeptidyl aminopeptidase/acylaminoacyl peptidase